MEDMVAKFDSTQRVFLFNVNERQREFEVERGAALKFPRGCDQEAEKCDNAAQLNSCRTSQCHPNPNHYLSRIACPAGDKPRGDYAVIQHTRDLAGQARF